MARTTYERQILRPRTCRNCERPIPPDKRAGTIYCATPECEADRARKRKAKSRRAAPGAVRPFIRPEDLPAHKRGNTPEFMAVHALNPERVVAHRVEYYPVELVEELKEEIGQFYEYTPVVDRAIRQSEGILMRKFGIPEFGPHPPQWRPDKPGGVITDPRAKWEKHDRVLPEGRKVLALVRRGDELELIPNQWVKKKRNRKGKWRRERVYGYDYSMELALDHIEREKEGQYDPETGEGSHNGANVKGWHRHTPRTGKYLLFGGNKRIDIGPDGLAAFKDAPRLWHIMEGKLKHLAVESHGELCVSSASTTLWDPKEVRWFARWMNANAPGAPILISADADCITNPQVFRQAMYLRTEYREESVQAFFVAPPARDGQHECECKPDVVGMAAFLHRLREDSCDICGGFLKGDDDYLAAGGTIDGFDVLNREEPEAAIFEYVHSLSIHGHSKTRAVRALRGLSLHDRDERRNLDVPLKTLQRIMRVRRPQDVPIVLEQISGALDITGALEISPQPYKREDGTVGEAWDWKARPTIRVREAFRSTEKRHKLGEFHMTTQQYMELRKDVDEMRHRVSSLERRADESNARDAIEDALSGFDESVFTDIAETAD